MTPSLAGYMKYAKRRLYPGYSGATLSAKLKVISWHVLSAVPRTISKGKSPIGRFLKKVTQKLGFDGMLIKREGITYVLVDNYSLEMISPYFEEWMWDILRPMRDKVFVDVGAHIGKFTLGLAKTAGLVVAVEPHPKNFKALERAININGFRNVYLLNKAAWNSNCMIRFFEDEDSARHSIKVNTRKYVTVEAIPLDLVLKKISRIDWIKIDVEGAECEVLEGLSETIEKHKPQIIIEVIPKYLPRLKELCSNFHYKIKRVHENQEVAYYLLAPNAFVKA